MYFALTHKYTKHKVTVWKAKKGTAMQLEGATLACTICLHPDIHAKVTSGQIPRKWGRSVA